MNYRLIVIENSLKDKSILTKYKLLSETKFGAGTSRESRMLKLLVPGSEVDSLSRSLRKNIVSPYYCHFYSESQADPSLIVVFSEKVFHTSKESYEDVVEYGIAHGVSRDEMDIAPMYVIEEKW